MISSNLEGQEIVMQFAIYVAYETNPVILNASS